MISSRTARRPRAAVALGIFAVLAVSGCQSDAPSSKSHAERVKSDPNERFTESDYGVKASPRVTDLKKVPKGGGREQVGRPYKVRGKWYYPKEQPGYSKVGDASWYGASFHGRLTANGEVYDMFGLSAAHPTFPLPSYARVTNTETGANVVVRVNDRGPYVEDRLADLSSKAAEMIGYKANGIGRIKLDYIGKAPLAGDDTPMLMASYQPGNVAPSIDDGLPSGVMLAMNETPQRTYAAPKSSLPGVRPVTGGALSIDAIIDDSLKASRSAANVPRSRVDPTGLVVASYAPEARRPVTGAAAAVGALARPVGAPARIELGDVQDPDLLNAIRAIAAKHGRLTADPDGEGVSYSLSIKGRGDVDSVLRELWRAGAGDAFALRD